MRVRIITPMAGVDFSWAAGDVVDVDKDLAAALCNEPEGEPRAEVVESSGAAKRRSTRVSAAKETRG